MRVSWSELNACDGFADATKIPASVDLLFSDDAEARERGYWGIDNCAVLQSSLFSSAPYTARLIVDRLIASRMLTVEVLEILYQLGDGYGPQLLEVGPLAGPTIEEATRSIVLEIEPLLREELRNEWPSKVCDLATELLNLFSSDRWQG